jgi:hypothetical protein
MPERLSVLLLCDVPERQAATVADHVNAFRHRSRHRVRTFNPRGLSKSWSLDLGEFDVVVVHYSVFVISDSYLAPWFRDALTRFEGLKVQFIQDEYRRVYEIGAMVDTLGIDVLFTCVPRQEWPTIWSEERLPGLVKIPTLTGYVPDDLAKRPPRALEERTIDVGYRGREVPWWLGNLGQEKVWIGQGVLARAEELGLKTDIAWTEGSRIYGEAWVRFISSCKAVLGTESGASITDFDGSLERRVGQYRADHPTAGYDEVHREILAPFEGNAPVIAISPRMFEAAALRTAMILFPGEYSGILQPDVHYIPLEKDFSNIADVAEKLRDRALLQSLVERAHADLVASGRYSYDAFIREFDDIVGAHARRRRKGMHARFHAARLEAKLRDSFVVQASRLRVRLPVPSFVSRGPLSLSLTLLMPGMRWMRRGRAAAVALGLILRNPGLRAAVSAYVRDRRARAAIPARQLTVDLVRLGHLSRDPGEDFRLALAFDRAQGRLGFVSRPLAVAEGRSQLVGKEETHAIETALRDGRLAINWNNAKLRESWRQRGKPTTGLGSKDVHRFEALERLGAHAPETVWRILEPVVVSSARATTSRP